MLVLFWFLASIVVGVIAAGRGKNGVGWFLLSIFITPILSLLLVLLTPSKKA